MRFLLDANLPHALKQRLSEAGYVAFHVLDRLAPNAGDAEIVEEANRLDAILVSKDRDFVDLSLRGVLRTPLLWIRLGNMTTPRLWAHLGPVMHELARALQTERIVEVGPATVLHSGPTSPK